MELKKERPIIYLISGKARHGKDTTANIVKEIYENNGKSVINLQFSSYIKEYAKKISDWTGNEEEKPRELLQFLGTEVIRCKIDENFFINKIIDDIKVYSYFFDVITISDVRFKKEIEIIKNVFSKVISLNIFRKDYDNGLTIEQKNHISEIDLDNYEKFDYILHNDGTLEDLEKNIIKIVSECNEKNK